MMAAAPKTNAEVWAEAQTQQRVTVTERAASRAATMKLFVDGDALYGVPKAAPAHT